MVIMLTDGYGSYPGRALAQVCQSARHHCGGKPIRFHTVQFPSNGSRGQVMEQIAESVRQQAAGEVYIDPELREKDWALTTLTTHSSPMPPTQMYEASDQLKLIIATFSRPALHAALLLHR